MTDDEHHLREVGQLALGISDVVAADVLPDPVHSDRPLLELTIDGRTIPPAVLEFLAGELCAVGDVSVQGEPPYLSVVVYDA